MSHLWFLQNHVPCVNSDAYRALQRYIRLMRGVSAPFHLINDREHGFDRNVQQRFQCLFGVSQMPPAQIFPRRQLRHWLVKFGYVQSESRFGGLFLNDEEEAWIGNRCSLRKIKAQKCDIRFQGAAKKRIVFNS